VLGLSCRNFGWTGGVVASTDLCPLGTADTLRTDSSWVCTEFEPGSDGGWATVGYDASAWIPAGDYGALRASDSFPPHIIPGPSQDLDDLRNHGAHWLWTPKTCYMRKTFTTDSVSATVGIRGNGFTYKLSLDGVLLGQQQTAQWRSDPLDQWPGMPLSAGEHVLAIEATCVDSMDFAFIKAGVDWRQGACLSDTTWRFSWAVETGWNDRGSVDASWQRVGQMTAYEGTTDWLTPATFVWPNMLWFRKEFSVPSMAVSKIRSASVLLEMPDMELYDLRGRRMGHHFGRASPRAAVQLLQGRTAKVLHLVSS
jgi:hypothetical protein